MTDCAEFAKSRADEMHHRYASDDIDADGLVEGLETIGTGWEAGLKRGLEGRRVMLGEPRPGEVGAFKPFSKIECAEDRLHIVMVSQSLPPESPGGVGRYLLDAAREFAKRGHEVRIITTGHGYDRVELQQGVWIHRIVKKYGSTGS